MAKEMGLDRAPIEFQTFYFSHVLVVPPSLHIHVIVCAIAPELFLFMLENETLLESRSICMICNRK